MKYEKLSNEQLQQYKYPNLIAELIESGYSICTCSEHMEYGRCEEDNQRVWDKLLGQEEFLASEFMALCKLFNADPDYLYSETLHIVNGKPEAFWKWFEWNKKTESEIQRIHTLEDIRTELQNKPYLLDFFKNVIKMDKEDVERITGVCRKIKNCSCSS